MRRLALAGAVLSALAVPALAQAAPQLAVARPNPALVGIRLDYDNPLPTPAHAAATLPRLFRPVIAAAIDDQAYLAFRTGNDLGGFVPAPVGRLILVGGGHSVLAPDVHAAEIPLLATAAGGKVLIFGYGGAGPPGGAMPAPPDNARQPLLGVGVPPTPPPPSADEGVPPANLGFGGEPGPPPNGGGGGRGGGTATIAGGTTTKITTTTTTTAARAPVEPATPTGGGGGGGPVAGAGACGVPGISITSDHPGCVITIASGVPGDSVSELMTVQNTSGSSYTLSLEAVGPNDNHLWQDLQMAVYEQGTPPPAPFPPLAFWLAGFNDLTTLAAGQTVTYVIVLSLPATAGNADLGESAVVGFRWQALG